MIPTEKQIDVAVKTYWRSRGQHHWRSNISPDTQLEIRIALTAVLTAALAPQDGKRD